MTEVELISSLVSTVGFPIAMVIYLLWDRRQNDLKLKDTIENNTLVLTKLCLIIDTLEDIVKETYNHDRVLYNNNRK